MHARCYIVIFHLHGRKCKQIWCYFPNNVIKDFVFEDKAKDKDMEPKDEDENKDLCHY